MPKFLKGNYRLGRAKQSAQPKPASQKDLTDEFEKAALAKLGGSLCFVMKKHTFVWAGGEPPNGA